MSDSGPRRRLNWFSPLPPSKTDVGHYAMRSLPSLARHFDITVWTERPYSPHELEGFARARLWEGEQWPALNAADATLYHIGNNARFHGWIWEIAQRHPGIVVLHDTGLHEFISAHVRSRDANETPLLSERAAMAAALEQARGAVVHSATAFQQIAALGRCPVVQLDLPYAAGAPVLPRAWDGTLRLIVFGYLGANRRLGSLLEAVATFRDRSRLQLEIFGEVEDGPAVEERIRHLALGEAVHIRGFVHEAELDDALDRAHLAVNLRFPSLGEASASQLRLWTRGLASIVTRTGWYAELPADAVWFVDPANEIADLQRHFAAALDNPQQLQAMGTAGRRHLEAHHAPHVYASELAGAVERMMQTPAPVIGQAVGVVSRILADAQISGDVKAAVARRVGEELTRWVR